MAVASGSLMDRASPAGRTVLGNNAESLQTTEGGEDLRNVTIEERSWSADDDDMADQEKGHLRAESDDPVTSAFLNYGYARI